MTKEPQKEIQLISYLHIPSYPLCDFIDHLFYYTDYTPEHYIESYIPDGEVQLIFDLTDTPKCIYDNDSLKEIQTCKKVWFSGFRTSPLTIPSGRDSELIIVQFKKGKASTFLNSPLHTVTNQVVDAELIFGVEILQIRTMILEQETMYDKLRTLERELKRHYLNKLVIDPFIHYAVSTIANNPNQYSIQELTSKVGYSQKHLIHKFKTKVGVSPKEFLKVVRFQKSVQEIQKTKNLNWAHVAYDCGYYDQSHFIADFKSYSGYTPVQYLEKETAYINYLRAD